MYLITDQQSGFLVECMVQDGWQRWTSPNRQEAIYSLISAARTLNGSYITQKDISFFSEKKDVNLFNYKQPEEHFTQKYNITQEECDMIVAIREGRLKVSQC